MCVWYFVQHPRTSQRSEPEEQKDVESGRDKEREDLCPGVIAGLGVPQTACPCLGQGITEMEEQKENRLPGRFLYRSLSHTTKG